MKKLCVLLILVAVAMAVNTRIETLLPPVDDKIDNSKPALRISSNNAPVENMPILGRQEVVGWTDYDWQCNGPSYSWCRLDPVANGIHVSWMYRLGTDPRNMRYNFYDFSSNAWNWPGTGINAFSISVGFGGMDYDPITGHAVITGHGGTPLLPQTARDISPGAGLFEYTVPTMTSLWPPVAVTNNQMIHIAASENDAGAFRDTVYYHRMTAWNTWAPHMIIHGPDAVPFFPTQNIAASKTSNKVVVMWTCSEDTISVRGYYRLSTDGGATWGAQTQMPYPPSTIPGAGYYITSLFAMFDNSDNLHIVTDISNGAQTVPAEIWHYCPTNPQPWTLIQQLDPDTLAGGVGSNALFACRPSIVQASGVTGNFYVAWEQFDTLNIEPTTTYSRADIWVAELTNSGQTVSRKGKITDPNTTSKRFPAIGGVKNDTIILMYMIDSIAGSYIQGQGVISVNPMVVHRLHRTSLPVAIEEQNPSNGPLTLSTALPNPFKFNTKISYSVPITGDVNLTVYDILGRPVKTLMSGTQTAGNYTAVWNGRTNTNESVKAGVYFYTLKTSDRQISHKIIKTN